ncbi:hypothetical protein Tco_0461230 [Tanacetum coccineum]
MQCVTMPAVKPKLLAPGMYAIDVEPIPPRNRNNREVHLEYLKHLKESVKIVREIVEEARIEKPLDNALESARLYTKRSQELLEHVIGTCLKESNKRDKKTATTPLNRKKQVIFKEPCDTLNNNTQTYANQQKVQQTNVHVIPSIGVISSTKASGSKPRSNTKNNRILPAKSDNKKKQVWKATGKIFVNAGYQWKPTGRKFTLGEQYPLTRIPTEIEDLSYQTLYFCQFSNADCTYHPLLFGLRLLKTYDEESLKDQEFREKVYRDNFEVAFRKHSCYIQDVDGVELLKGFRGSNLKARKYTVWILQKISRKRLNPGKHGHGNRRGRKEQGEGYKMVKTSPSTLIGGDPRKNDTVDMKEAQGNRAYTFEVLTKMHKHCHNPNCLAAGNPCELRCDPTAKINLPMIEGMKGRD